MRAPRGREPRVRLRFAEPLRFFLAPARRPDGVAAMVWDGTSTAGHLIEAAGVPLTEVGRLERAGEPVPASCRPAAGETLDVAPVARPQPPGGAPVRFVLDVHLGKLARRLRILGVDCRYASDAADDELIDVANAEHRILLTKDRGVLRQRRLWLGGFVRGSRPDEELADVLDRFAPPLAPWTRCPACNGMLAEVPKEEIADRLLPGTRRSYDEFARCDGCGRVYWHGAHSRRLDPLVAAARSRPSGPGSGRARARGAAPSSQAPC